MANLRCIHCNINYTYDEVHDLDNRCPNCRSAFHVVNVDPPPSPSERAQAAPNYYARDFRGTVIDPYLMAKVIGINDDAMFQIFKKAWRGGQKPGNSLKQELIDIIRAAQRRLDIIEEHGL